MAQQWDVDEDQQDGTDLVRDLRRQLKELSKRNSELETSLENVSKQSRARTVADFVKSKGLDEKVAKLIPSSVEASDEGLQGWLSEFGDVFGLRPVSGDAAEADAGTPEQAVDPEVRGQLQRVQQVTPAASASAPDLEARIKSAGSAEELMAVLRGESAA